MIDHKSLRAEVREWRARKVEIEGTVMPASVPFLIGALSNAADPFEHDFLLAELGDEYFRAGLEGELLRVQRERVTRHPDLIVPWLSLASSLSTNVDAADEARRAVEKGVELARQQGVLVRYALICQANVAKQLRDPGLFASSLADLISDAPNERSQDCLFSAHVIDGLTEDFCPSELLEQYRRLL